MLKIILNDFEKLSCYPPPQDCQKGIGNCIISYFFPKTYHLALHENVKRNLNTNTDSLNPSDAICH